MPGVSVVAQIFSIDTSESDFIGESLVRFNVPMRGVMESMMGVMMSMRVIFSST